jgi:hypothetical protein
MGDLPSISDPAVIRRLVLAKQLYLHGSDHSMRPSPLDKMIGVHNLHNALEIVLRAIMLSFDIRAEKELNISFENLWTEIANAKSVKDRGLRLSYSRDLRKLNQARNLVQHDALEPTSGTMEDWRVLTSRFLRQTYQDFFGLDFDQLSTIDFVADADIRNLLRAAERQLSRGSWIQAVQLSKVAFQAASESLHEFLPSEGFNSPFFVASGLRHEGASVSLERAVESIFKRIRATELFAAVVSSGVAVADYKQLEQNSPNVVFAIGGNPILQSRDKKRLDAEETAKWVFNFCSTAILNWQAMGMEPKLRLVRPDGLREWLKKLESATDAEASDTKTSQSG